MNNLIDTKRLNELSKSKEIVNIIYLDIDGVLSTVNTEYSIDKTRVDLLMNFIKSTPNTYIILTSSWRYSTFDLTYEKYRTNDVDNVHGLYEVFEYVIGQTERSNHRIRGEEINKINKYLHRCDLKFKYIILDDDSDMLYHQRFSFIKTHTLYGISQHNIDNMFKHFRNKKTPINVILTIDDKCDSTQPIYEKILFFNRLDSEHIMTAVSLPIFELIDDKVTPLSHDRMGYIMDIFNKFLTDNFEFDYIFDLNINESIHMIHDKNDLFYDALTRYFNIYCGNNVRIIDLEQ